MKIAFYAFVSPIIVAGMVLGLVGLMIRGAWASLNLGWKLPEYMERKRRAKDILAKLGSGEAYRPTVAVRAPAYGHAFDSNLI